MAVRRLRSRPARIASRSQPENCRPGPRPDHRQLSGGQAGLGGHSRSCGGRRSSTRAGCRSRPCGCVARHAGHGLHPGVGGGDVLHDVPAVSPVGQQGAHPGVRHHALHAARRGRPDEGLQATASHHEPHHAARRRPLLLGGSRVPRAPAPMRRWSRSSRTTYFEDLTAWSRSGQVLDGFAAGKPPRPGSQTGRRPRHALRVGRRRSKNLPRPASSQ